MAQETGVRGRERRSICFVGFVPLSTAYRPLPTVVTSVQYHAGFAQKSCGGSSQGAARFCRVGRKRIFGDTILTPYGDRVLVVVFEATKP